MHDITTEEVILASITETNEEVLKSFKGISGMKERSIHLIITTKNLITKIANMILNTIYYTASS